MLSESDTKNRSYVNVVEDDGVDYREIAGLMTELGHSMKHSSVHNYVLRVMRKFVDAIAHTWRITLDEKRVDEIAKDPCFQHGISDLLHAIELQRRDERDKQQNKEA